MTLLLAYQPAFDWPALLGFLARRAIIGLETVVECTGPFAGKPAPTVDRRPTRIP
jgi:hypothetical protein